MVYGAGLDANTLYSAMSRARHRVDLVLPRTLLESDTDRARLGEPASQDEALRRAINAYATKLAGDRPDGLVSTQLDDLEAQTRELRDRVRRLQRTVEPAPAGSWRERPHGRLQRPCPGRRPAARRAGRPPGRTGRRRSRPGRRDQLTAAQADQGPRVRRLRQVHADLAAAAHHDQVADQHAAAARATRARIGDLSRDLQRSRLALRLAGTSRDQIHQQIRDLVTEATAADHAADIARGTAAQHHRAAGTEWVRHRAADALTDLRSGWDRRLIDARTGDITAAHQAHDTARGAAGHAATLRGQRQRPGRRDPPAVLAHPRAGRHRKRTGARLWPSRSPTAARRRAADADPAPHHRRDPHRGIDRGGPGLSR